MMGYQTPNIDRIANEGVLFTDYYAEQSCTAGRSSFITGQSGLRTGMTKVGLPGATLGLQKEDPTIAELLKPLGYATGQFGKNHLGDRNEFLPTVHGFDEFYGNLYHLNAEEEPELPDYPKAPAFRERYGPRGVMDCKASDRDDQTVDPRFGKIGKQVCTDTGPLTRARMVGIDDDITNRAVDFIKRQKNANKPFFVWVNTTHMHFRTHTKPESIGQSGRWQSPYHDTMIDHDKNVGSVLKALDDLGIADNTFVMYLTGQVAKSPRESFFYINDDQQLTGLHYDNWKLVFMEQRAPGTLRVWSEPFTSLRVPKIFNLRTDPYERADITSNTYYDWLLDHAFQLVPAQDYVGQFLLTFRDYPQRQKAASFNMDEIFAKLKESSK
jgi:arylsulfatase A-like enzyme